MNGRLSVGMRIWFGVCALLAGCFTGLIIYGGIVAIEWLRRH